MKIVLLGSSDRPSHGSVGARIPDEVRRARLRPERRAWDLLALALAAIAADLCVRRDRSPDGWTRQLELEVAVQDALFWRTQQTLVERLLRFLTTDIWTVKFVKGGAAPKLAKKFVRPKRDSVVLLSGGLDSLVGAIDLVTMRGKRPYAVSQIAKGDSENQRLFAAEIGGGLPHLQLNHNVTSPDDLERSQRARSIVFLAYGVLVASSLRRYRDGDSVTLYVCENGFISINPPLTGARLGSLSTRTTHPTFLRLFQDLLEGGGLRVRLENPYQAKTKGEMLIGCADQTLLLKYASMSTSCGRFARNGYRHCGRCVPCLVRRASFMKWGVKDETVYIYRALGRNDDDHARFDDVRSLNMAILRAKSEGVESLSDASLLGLPVDEVKSLRDVVARGLGELESLFKRTGVR